MSLSVHDNSQPPNYSTLYSYVQPTSYPQPNHPRYMSVQSNAMSLNTRPDYNWLYSNSLKYVPQQNFVRPLYRSNNQPYRSNFLKLMSLLTNMPPKPAHQALSYLSYPNPWPTYSVDVVATQSLYSNNTNSSALSCPECSNFWRPSWNVLTQDWALSLLILSMLVCLLVCSTCGLLLVPKQCHKHRHRNV